VRVEPSLLCDELAVTPVVTCHMSHGCAERESSRNWQWIVDKFVLAHFPVVTLAYVHKEHNQS
ncbi:11096_t:CDS:2, partial [Acaulospora morrowiae]